MVVPAHSRAHPGGGDERPAATRVAGRYELIERLAQGGMGEVFAARELSSGRLVALKRLLPTAMRRQALFRAEYHLLARLEHPYIIDVYEFGLDGELPFYTMELLDGHDLREAPQVSFSESCRILRDVACSLALLHGQRLLHRDVSPRNVRRTSNGRCKLIDFGTMVPFGVPPNVAGTPPFVAPEAMEGGLLDQRSDLYSLGALAYWLFSRRLPGSARTIERNAGPREPLPPLGKVARDVPEAMEELVMSLLEFDPSKRPGSAMEVISRLTAIGGLPGEDTELLARSHLISSGFVGQKRVLHKADKAIKRALLCNGGALLAEADDSAGKTRLLQEVSLLAQTQGFSVVRAFAKRSAAGVHVARELYRGLHRAAPDAFERLLPSERAALAGFDWQETSSAVAQPAETRARLQWALSAYFRVVAKTSPWLVLIDDFDLADEFSAAFVAALATMAETLPILIVVTASTVQRRSPSSSFFALSRRAQHLLLSPLDEKGTRALVSSVFGRVAHRGRLVSFLYRAAHGNPGLTMELCAWLLERGVIRYVDGAFVLPDGEIREQLPAGTAAALTLRLDGISTNARDLVELLATCRGGASLDLCLAASPVPSEEVLSAIDQLVSRAILIGSGSEYVFAQEALRSSVRITLPAERSRLMHERLASAFLSLERGGPLRQLEAGWHLVHTDRELEGAELLGSVTPPLIESGVAYQDAIAGLEKALEVFERRGTSLERRIMIRTSLARASYLYDYRLADRHAAQTVQLLRDWCGLSVLERWQRFIPASLWVVFCFVLIFFRRLFRARVNRGPGPLTSIQCLGRAVVSTIGVRVTALDGEAARALLRNLEVMRDFSSISSAPAAYAAASALALQPFGREADLARALEHARKKIDGRLRFDMSEPERLDIRVGLQLSGGINECYRIGSQALLRADQLEAEGTRLAEAAAHRIRFTYYTVRGMREKAEQFRRELDIHGIQGGTTWQVEWFAVPTEGMAGSQLGDLVGAVQALERLEQLVKEMPSLRPLRDMVKLGCHVCLGEYAQAIEQGQRFVAAHPPRSVIGWGSAYGAYATALNRTGRHRDAIKLCEEALAALTEGDLEYVIMYGGLQRELAIAWASSGEFARGQAYADAYIARLEAAGEHALVAHAYESRAQLAQNTRDHSLLAQALIAMRDAAERAGSSTVIEYAAKVTQKSLRSTTEIELPGQSRSGSTESAELISSEATPAGGVKHRGRASLLQRVMRSAHASGALLFSAPDNDGPARLVDAAGKAEPSALLALAVRPLLAAGPQVGNMQTLEVEQQLYEVVHLPLEQRGDRPSLLLLLRAQSGDTIPVTLLARLAERVKSELSLSQEPSDSVPDSDFSETFG